MSLREARPRWPGFSHATEPPRRSTLGPRTPDQRGAFHHLIGRRSFASAGLLRTHRGSPAQALLGLLLHFRTGRGLSRALSLRKADEVSSNDFTGGIFNRLISSDVGFAENSRVTVVRLSAIQLRNSGAINVERASNRACTVVLLYRSGHTHVLVTAFYENSGHAPVLFNDILYSGVVQLGVTEVKVSALDLGG